jgi:hypothetical protein
MLQNGMCYKMVRANKWKIILNSVFFILYTECTKLWISKTRARPNLALFATNPWIRGMLYGVFQKNSTNPSTGWALVLTQPYPIWSANHNATPPMSTTVVECTVLQPRPCHLQKSCQESYSFCWYSHYIMCHMAKSK